MKNLNINNIECLKNNENFVIDKETSKKMTGYASIDKPWEKYYRKTPIRDIKSNQTIYDMIFNENINNMDNDALSYLDVNLTFKDLKNKVDQFADALIKSGVKYGDVVLMGTFNSTETYISLLAINKIGAVSKWFDIRATEKDIENYLNSNNIKLMITFDALVPKILNISNNTQLEKLIVINPINSLSYVKQKLYKIKTKKEKNNKTNQSSNMLISFEDFTKSGNLENHVEKAIFDASKPSIMIQSSGTTGKPKTIVHSDLSCVNSIRNMAYSDLPLGIGKKILVALPPWIAYGSGNAILMPLAFGTKVELCPNFNPDIVYKYVGKYTICFAAPFHYRYLRDNFNKLTKKQLKGFEKIDCLVSGGDKISIEENKEFEEVFNKTLVNGYGNNECWGVLTVNPTLHNKYGTVGIPKYDDIIISYDDTNKKENLYGDLGEICSLTNSKLLYYENNEEETQKIKQTHEDGNSWIHTGDLGFIDENGFVHLVGRTRRIIIRLGFKVSAYTIEEKISEHFSVKECVAVSVKDEAEEHVPMIYVVLKDKYKNLEKEMQDDIYIKCEKELKEYEIPKHFKFVNELPYTQGGKYDFVLLEKLGNEYVDELTKNNILKDMSKTKKNR